ncbi:MAG TPA: hypothetical protein VMF11_00275 [Candidatus Baltobacteraceae bacterium]|nr:hypothetical protein [Candidatus Baltobacteraceae bacterium]
MPVPMEVQSTIAQRYAQLGNAVTHDPTQEASVLAPHFKDRARMKLATFEYDPLTVLVRKIVLHGNRLEVYAEYVGIHGHSTNTIDRWIKIAGEWRLLDRN